MGNSVIRSRENVTARLAGQMSGQKTAKNPLELTAAAAGHRAIEVRGRAARTVNRGKQREEEEEAATAHLPRGHGDVCCGY